MVMVMEDNMNHGEDDLPAIYNDIAAWVKDQQQGCKMSFLRKETVKFLQNVIS